ncbi:MAG TPA: DUF2341 domain-containing protein [Rectinemataceae bacterium]|nr:DUF2341 domain-containing protein [Rectinemataceae bacterium]
MFHACSPLGAWDLLRAQSQATKRLSVDLSQIAQSQDLADFPILIRLNPSTFPYTECRPDGLDLRVVAEDGTTPLAFEREAWNPSGQTNLWVKLPLLAASPAITRIWLYFGDDQSRDSSNPAAVWSNGYLIVLHGRGALDASGVMRYTNSLGTNGPGSPGPYAAPTDAPGASPPGGDDFGFGAGTAFKSGMIFPVSTALNDLPHLTFEAWIRDNGTTVGGMLFFKGANLNLSIQSAEAIRFAVAFSSTALQADSPTAFLAAGSWRHLALTWDGSSAVAMYGDGQAVSPVLTASSGVRLSDSADQLEIGNDDKPAVAPGNLTADMDEIRISNVARSAAWIEASYLSQSADRLVFGSEEDLPK